VNLSICITLRNRAGFMKGKLDELLAMDYDPKLLEVCVTDGGSTDGITDLLRAYAPRFGQIKYALSDRSRLPFRVASNNPACDVNAQVVNVATWHMCVRTDAEVRFQRKDSLKLIRDTLATKRALSFDCLRLKPGCAPPLLAPVPAAGVDRKSRDAFFCVAFDRRLFIKRGGVEEFFAQGFAGEDTYFHWWWRRHHWMNYAPAGHEVTHIDHGQVNTPDMVRLRNAVTLPLIRRMKTFRVPPNYGNPAWTRLEMIAEVQTWRA
jgi:hypothetical protein